MISGPVHPGRGKLEGLFEIQALFAVMMRLRSDSDDVAAPLQDSRQQHTCAVRVSA
jgi:hypothetical protein